MDQPNKPRYDRSALKILKAREAFAAADTSKIPGARGIKLAPTQQPQWRPITMKTLGYLAAQAKVTIIQVHHLIPENISKKAKKTFRDAFLGSINLRKPTKKNMDQIQLYSHLLFV